MPLEIRELVIKATIEPDHINNTIQPTSTNAQGAKNEEIVQKCVETVLEILKDKMER